MGVEIPFCFIDCLARIWQLGLKSYVALLDVWTGHHGIHPLLNTKGVFKFRTGYPAYINSMNNRYLNLYSAAYVSS
jgi:hypothetical protein